MGRVFVHLHGKAKNSSFRAAISDYANRLVSDGVQIIEHRNKTEPGPYLDEVIKKAGNDEIILLVTHQVVISEITNISPPSGGMVIYNTKNKKVKLIKNITN